MLVYLQPLLIGLNKRREGGLSADDGFYLHVTEDPIYETKLVHVELITSASVQFS